MNTLLGRAMRQSALGPLVGLSVAFGFCGLAGAETRPSLNFYGATGLIDMPSAEMQPDGMLSVSTAHFGSISRTTLSFQITPRLSGAFRYNAIRGWNDAFCPPDCEGGNSFDTFYDRAFDLRFLLIEEGRYWPALAIGLQDIAGTGLQAGEYVVATKHVLPSVKVTAGLGWGRLGSSGSIGAPFGPRPGLDVGEGGTPNADQWFRGNAAPFAGVEWQINDKWAFKAEYSSDNYDNEDGTRGTFDRRSPYSFGIEYQRSDSLRFGVYSMYGSEVGFAAHYFMNPKRRPGGGVRGPGPNPVEVRPSRAADPEAWDPDWINTPNAGQILRDGLQRRLDRDAMQVEALSYSLTTVQVRFRNPRIDSGPQAIGRVARALSAVMPASVETFEIVPVVEGVPTAMVTIRRSDLEALEFAPGNDALMYDRAGFSDAGPLAADAVRGDGLYPRLTWGLAPYLRTGLFDPDDPLRADLGLRLSARYDIAPGLVLSGSIAKKLAGNLNQSDRESTSVLPHVRTDGALYAAQGDPAIESLTLAWYGRPAANIYGRVTAGYLERMFGGVSVELLWKRPDSRLALGAEANYVAQRDYDQLFGFRDYDVVTGHVSAYYDFGGGFLGQIDVGRYLAGDVGATVSLDREFANGWKVGAFATLTDVSAEEFGEGSFDKGIRINIPVAWLAGNQTRRSLPTTLRPITRDGGARLDVEGRLYPMVRDYHAQKLGLQWGRFWR